MTNFFADSKFVTVVKCHPSEKALRIFSKILRPFFDHFRGKPVFLPNSHKPNNIDRYQLLSDNTQRLFDSFFRVRKLPLNYSNSPTNMELTVSRYQNIVLLHHIDQL